MDSPRNALGCGTVPVENRLVLNRLHSVLFMCAQTSIQGKCTIVQQNNWSPWYQLPKIAAGIGNGRTIDFECIINRFA